MKKTYTKEQKNEVLARLFAGEPIASISVDTGIAINRPSCDFCKYQAVCCVKIKCFSVLHNKHHTE